MSYKKGIFQKNFCRAKAVNLPKNKTVTVLQTDKYTYTRWYKIVLTKKQGITYWTNKDVAITLYDSDYNSLACEGVSSESTKYFTSARYPAGTYYARISYNKWACDYVTFKDQLQLCNKPVSQRRNQREEDQGD